MERKYAQLQRERLEQERSHLGGGGLILGATVSEKLSAEAAVMSPVYRQTLLIHINSKALSARIEKKRKNQLTFENSGSNTAVYSLDGVLESGERDLDAFESPIAKE